MKMIRISDITLREIDRGRTAALSFKERVEIARTLDRLQVDAIELPPIHDCKADTLSNKTIASIVEFAQLTATAGLTEESVEQAWESIKGARRAALQILIPASAVQMEYQCHKKAPAMLELVRSLTAKARYYCETVEVSLLDATRAERDFLYQAAAAAAEAGASAITLCDSAGICTGTTWSSLLQDIRKQVEGVRLGVELSDELHMAVACAHSAIEQGAGMVKTSISPMNVLLLEEFEKFVHALGDEQGIRVNLRTTELARAAGQIQWMLQTQRSSGSPFDSGVDDGKPNICLTGGDDASEVAKVVRRLGYELNEEDNAKVFESFQRIAAKKHFVSTRELDAIVATAAMQVPAAYRIANYVITSGNTISAMANLALEKDGERQQGIAVGDGPVDAAFLAIEQIIGHHYELADYQLQTVTEGREAMGSALVKLRSNGKLYSGSGISTDVIGASIRAYISALNKIIYEEA